VSVHDKMLPEIVRDDTNYDIEQDSDSFHSCQDISIAVNVNKQTHTQRDTQTHTRTRAVNASRPAVVRDMEHKGTDTNETNLNPVLCHS